MKKDIMKNISRAFLLLVMAASLASLGNCKKSSGESISISMGDFISAYDANNQVQVLDVRTPEEYAGGHVPGAKLLPLSEVESGADVPYAKDSQIYVICRSGHRSFQATQYLRSHGFDKAVSVDGGTMAWIGAGKPTEN